MPSCTVIRCSNALAYSLSGCSLEDSVAEGLSFCIEESGTSVKLGEIANATLASIANTIAFSILPSTLRATNPDITNLHGLFHTLGISVSGGLGLGLLAGFVRTR